MRKRMEGMGPIRLNTSLKLRVGSYSMLFVSSLYPEYIYSVMKKEHEDRSDLQEIYSIAKYKRDCKKKVKFGPRIQANDDSVGRFSE